MSQLRDRIGGRKIADLTPQEFRAAYPPMAGGAIQSEEVIGYAFESVYGTFVAPTKFVPCIPSIRTNQKVVRPDQARGTRAQVVDAVVGHETEATLTGELIPEVWPGLCAAAMGSGSDTYSSTGGAATHALAPRPQLPSVSLEVDVDVIAGEQTVARQIVGCFVDRFQLRATNQALAQVECQLIGQREITPATPGAPSNANPTISTLQPMDFSLLAVTYKSVSSTQLKDATVALLNHTQRVFSSNGKLYAARLVATKREVTLQTMLDFLDTNFYSDWVNGVKTSGMVLTFTSGTNIPNTSTPYSVAFTLPGLRAMGEYALQSASDVIEQNLSWSATVSGANEMSSSWTNSEAGAYV